MMKLAATVTAVLGLIVLSIVVTARFLEPEPVGNNRDVPGQTDDDFDKTVETRRHPNPDVMQDRNSQAVKTRLPAIESNQERSESLGYIAGFQAGKEAGIREAEEARLQAARERHQEFENREYNSYDMATLRTLAEGMDRKAQVALARKLLRPSPGANDDTEAEALEYLRAASESGEPLAATLAATVTMLKDPVRGYAYLLKFAQKHGEDPDVSRSIGRYPYIQTSFSPEELMRRAQLYLENDG